MASSSSPLFHSRRFPGGGILAGVIAVLFQVCAFGAEPVLVQSVAVVGTRLQLNVATEWERRYRVESSSDLTNWKTVVVSEPAEGSSTGIQVPMEPVPAGFFKVSVFEWEELQAVWQDARQRWREQGVTTYQFEFQWGCHCPFIGWSRVQVSEGVVTGVVSVETGEPLPREQWSTFLTVEGLFDWIEARRRLLPVELRAEFDPILGHPRSGYFDLSRLLADEELGFELRSLTF